MNKQTVAPKNSEDKGDYYYANKQRIPLVKEPSVYAVHFQAGKDSRDSSLSRQAFRMLHEESENVGFIPNYGLQIYQTSPDPSSRLLTGEPGEPGILSAVKQLQSEPPVEYAAVAYRRNAEVPTNKVDDLMFVTLEFVVQFKPYVTRTQIDELNARYGVEIVKPLGYAPNGFLLKAPRAEGENNTVALANTYYESGLVEFANPDFVRRRHLRQDVRYREQPSEKARPKSTGKKETASRSDFLTQQWHLQTAKVVDAWNITRGNSSIKVAILDDGVDTAHPEFVGKIAAEFDFASGTADGNPNNNNDKHGTACAGVAVAKGTKAFGAAPGCSLIAVHYPDFLGSAEEAEMFKWTSDQGADVISCSWGPEDGTGAVDPLPDNVRAAIHYCVTQGRSGKGIPIFWAAGNGNESVSNDGYASNPEIMAIAASSNNETRSWYSDFGPEVFICAPSSGDGNLGERRIFTTDRRSSQGYNPSASGVEHPAGELDYTDDFGGTSSATPLVAGIAGLMLSANPNLRVQDVRQILSQTTDRIDEANGNYDGNGHSDLYGYGRVNAQRAVEMARTFGSGGGGGNSGGTGQPAITAPENINREDAAPVFQIDTGGRQLYAVEVATQAELFNAAANGNDRTADNFYGSWQDGLSSDTPYTLPTEVWDRLKSGDALFYRLHVADDNSWSNYGVTVSDSNSSSAPQMSITSDTGSGGGGGNSGGTGQPAITAPESINREDAAPVFEINKGGRQLYAVEVATQAELFNAAANGNDRTTDNFYGSWQDGLSSDTPYTLPTEVWDRLKSGDALFYRLHVADDNSWSNYGVTVSDSDASSAPVMQISGNDRTKTSRARNESATQAPTITGPERYLISDEAPTFLITLGQNSYYAVEVATHPDLFNRQYEVERNENNFYGSWAAEGLIKARNKTTYTLPENTWQLLRQTEGLLFYRVVTSSSQGTQWSNVQTSTSDQQADQAPWIKLFGGRQAKTEGASFGYLELEKVMHEDDALWRGNGSHS